MIQMALPRRGEGARPRLGDVPGGCDRDQGLKCVGEDRGNHKERCCMNEWLRPIQDSQRL